MIESNKNNKKPGYFLVGIFGYDVRYVFHSTYLNVSEILIYSARVKRQMDWILYNLRE